MAQRLATVAGVIGFLICLATAFVLALGFSSKEPNA
jgi:hypothetical protein